MPVWLQVAGAIASAILSYMTSYDDSNVKEMISDVAYNINLALQKLDDISQKIDNLLVEIKKLPQEIREIFKEENLSQLNNSIQGCIIQYQPIVAIKHDTSDVRDRIKDIYSQLSEASAKLQALSMSGEVRLTPLAALLSPVALLLELALLYRLGAGSKELRAQTLIRYSNWFSDLLDGGRTNSLVSAVIDASGKLSTSDGILKESVLEVAIKNVGQRQAFYCLEHQIGSKEKWWRTVGTGGGGVTVEPTNQTIAEVLGETWVRLYGVVTVQQVEGPHIPLWQLGGTGGLEVEDYARKAYTDAWYTPKPKWDIAIDSYDSGDVNRFEGQTGIQRLNDVKNSEKWRTFLNKTWPDAYNELDANNEARLYDRVSRDVLASVEAARELVDKGRKGSIKME